jgi:hypothetical protein
MLSILFAQASYAKSYDAIVFLNHGCPCSHRLMPEIMTTLNKYKSEINVNFLNITQVDQKGKQILEKNWNLSSALNIDEGKKIAKEYNITATPSIVDRKSVV